MIKGDRVNLIPLREEDVEMIRQWRNKNKDHFYDANEISIDKQKAWYEKYRETSTDRMYVIILKNGEKIGTMALFEINITDRTARLGRVLLLEEYRGQGYAEEAVRLLSDYGFHTMKLFKIKTDTHIDNIDAIAIYARAGFKSITRPIMLLEKINPDCDWKKPLKMEDGDYNERLDIKNN